MDTILSWIPDSLIPILIGLGLWFGVCFLFAPTLTSRAIDRHVSAECNRGSGVCACIFEDIRENNLDNAVFISTGGVLYPQVKLFSSGRNAYIDYVSLEAQSIKRVKVCNGDSVAENVASPPVAKAPVVVPNTVKADPSPSLPSIPSVTEDDLKDVAKTIKDIDPCEQVGVLSDDLKRLCNLQKDTSDETLSWWELGVAKSKKLREDLTHKWNL